MQIWVEKGALTRPGQCWDLMYESTILFDTVFLQWRVFHHGVDAFLGLCEDIHTYRCGSLADGGKEERYN